MGEFLTYMAVGYTGDEPIAIVWDFVWPPMGVSDKMYKRLLHLANTKRVFCICKRNMYLDQVFSEQWRKIGIKNIRIDVDYGGLPDTFVFGDYVLQLIPGREFREHSKLVRGLMKSVDSSVISFIYKSIFQRFERYVLIGFKDAVLARQLRNEVVSYFD